MRPARSRTPPPSSSAKRRFRRKCLGGNYYKKSSFSRQELLSLREVGRNPCPRTKYFGKTKFECVTSAAPFYCTLEFCNAWTSCINNAMWGWPLSTAPTITSSHPWNPGAVPFQPSTNCCEVTGDLPFHGQLEIPKQKTLRIHYKLDDRLPDAPPTPIEMFT